MTKARAIVHKAIVHTGELESAMGRTDRAIASDQKQETGRIASLTSMCRNLTAELFADERQTDTPNPDTKGVAEPIGSDKAAVRSQPAVPVAGPAPALAAALPGDVDLAAAATTALRRSDMSIPPPPPHWPAWPSVGDRPRSVAQQLAAPEQAAETPAAVPAVTAARSAIDSQDTVPEATPAAIQFAARDLAALSPRRFGSVGVVPASPAAQAASSALSGEVVADHPIRPQKAAQPLERRGEVPSGDQRLRRAPQPSQDGALPSLPKFLDPGPLVVAEDDRPAWINTGSRPPSVEQPQPAASLGAARRLIPAPPRVRFGAFSGVLMFIAVAGAGVAAAALAPQITSLLHQDNAPQIVVSEVEGVSGAVVPLPVSIDPAEGTVLSTVVIDGVPEGARLSAGRVNVDGSWILPPEELPDLAIMPPRGFSGEIFLEVRAVAVDGAVRVAQSETMHITIIPANRTPQIRNSRRI